MCCYSPENKHIYKLDIISKKTHAIWQSLRHRLPVLFVTASDKVHWLNLWVKEHILIWSCCSWNEMNEIIKIRHYYAIICMFYVDIIFCIRVYSKFFIYCIFLWLIHRFEFLISWKLEKTSLCSTYKYSRSIMCISSFVQNNSFCN